MTRKNGARTATGTAKESVQHAAEAVAPYAASAKEQCLHAAHEARDRLGPKVSDLADSAQEAYGAHVAPRVRKVRRAMPPEVDKAAKETARKARDAASYAAPRIAGAAAATKAAAAATKSAAGPAGREAASRSTAALSALKGEVSPEEISRLARKRRRRELAVKTAKGTVVVGALGAGAVVVWRWWDRQVNPDWMVEPPEPTEVADGDESTSSGTTRIVDDTEYMNREARADRAGAALDPEVQAKQAESESGDTADASRGHYERKDDR